MATDKKRSLLTEDGPSRPANAFRDEKDYQENFVPPSGFKPPTISKELITDAIKDTKDSRATALDNAHKALVDAFGPKIDQMLKKDCEAPKQQLIESTSTVLTMDDLEKMLLEMGMELADDDMVKECRKRLDECKDPALSESDKEKMYKDIHRKFWAYVQSLPTRKITEISNPSDTDKAIKKFLTNKNSGNIRWISYEGSLMISALVGVDSIIAMSQLPEGDRKIITDIVQDMTKKKVEIFSIWASFDEYKNLVTRIASSQPSIDEIEFTLGNRVASIPPSESTSRLGGSDVKVERKGKDILIGDRIKLEKDRIQNLAQLDGTQVDYRNRNNGYPQKQKVSGRNAYEIRADVLEMALDWAKNSSKHNNMDADDVLDIAESFYSFVEHK